MPELCFVLANGQNWFFRELVDALRAELRELGHPSSVVVGNVPPASSERVWVFVPPHEYVALQGLDALPTDPILKRSVFLCAEQPETSHFDSNTDLARRAGAVFDINPRSVRAFGERGIVADHFQLGYTRHWDHFDVERERDVDIVFLGSDTHRRSRLLAASARVLSRWNCHLQISDNSRPNTGDSPTFLADAKWDLLARTKILVNLHQGAEPYFESLRAMDAFHCGAVLVSEHSSAATPLVAGIHYMAASPASVALVADRLLRDPGRLSALRTQAHGFIQSRLRMRDSVIRLVAAAERLSKLPVAETRRPGRPPRTAVAGELPGVASGDAFSGIRTALKDVRLDFVDLRRRLARLEHVQLSGEAPQAVVKIAATPAWEARRRPRVSILTALYNHRDLIVNTLESVPRSRLRDLELIVVDDGSTDGSRQAARNWLERNVRVPALLVAHPVNRGLGSARNTAIDFARGTYAFVLDADNEFYPRCLPALAYALDADHEAAFSYAMLEAFGLVDAYERAGGSALLNKFAWEPARLRQGNFIDAMALMRIDVLRSVGKYTTDRRLYGWEDYDLWCRLAERGHRGILVPQILGRYRASPASMLSITNLSGTAGIAALVERYPRLMAGVSPPL